MRGRDRRIVERMHVGGGEPARVGETACEISGRPQHTFGATCVGMPGRITVDRGKTDLGVGMIGESVREHSARLP